MSVSILERPTAEARSETKVPPVASSPNWASNATLLTVVTVLVSLGNYAYSFIVVHLLSARDFSRFSAAQGLMLVLGSGCMAAIPWAMARFIAEDDTRQRRREAMHFGLVASTLQGVTFAVIAGGVLWLEAGAAVGATVAVSAFAASIIAVPVGFLQGADRMRSIVGIRLLEFVVRFGSGVIILLTVSRSADAALFGYPIGAAVLVLAGLCLCRSGLRPAGGEQAIVRALARRSVSLGAIQVFLAMLGALDTVAAVAAHLSDNATASYQSAALLGRIPLFFSAAIGLAAYVHVVSARDDAEVRVRMGQAARLFFCVAVPLVITCATVPDAILYLLIPARYGDAIILLRFTAVSGAAVGWIDIVSTAHQARGRFNHAIRILGLAAVAQPVVLICAGRAGGIWLFAVAAVAVSVSGALAVTIDARRWLPRRPPLLPTVAAGIALGGGIAARGNLPVWIGLVIVMGVVSLRALRSAMAPVTAGPAPAADAVADHGLEVGNVALAAPQPRRPRVLIVGDSFSAGLGASGASFGRFVAEDLDAAVLDISAISKATSEALDDGAAIRAFAPDLVLLSCGGTESLVHPGPRVRTLLERWGPPSWRGVTGLEPRVVYSRDARKRRRQRVSAAIRVTLKRVIIRLTGGGRRVSLEAYREALTALADLLGEVDCAMVFLSMWRVDERLFPGTNRAMDDTQAVMNQVLSGRRNVRLVEIYDVLRCFEDYLQDNLHLSRQGHRRLADVLTPVAREMLDSRLLEPSRAAEAVPAVDSSSRLGRVA